MKTEPGLFTMMAHPAQATQAVAGPRGGLATARSRFILCITFGYLVFALGWILLSDQLLSAFSDLAAMVWLSTAKGLLFVAASSAVFFCALHAVPPARSEPGDTLLGALTAGIAAGRHSRWLTYGFAITVSVAMLCMRQGMGSGFSARPLLILLMFPIILSALLGGLGPGLVATAVVALGSNFLSIPPGHSFSFSGAQNLVPWAFLVVNGLAVSLLSELLHRALHKVEVHRSLLNAVVSGTPDAIFVKNGQGQYQLVNAAAAAFVGMPAAEIVGRDDGALFSQGSAQDIMAADQAIMAGGAVQTREEQLTTRDGKTRVFLVTKGPMLDEAGQSRGLFGICRDITERHAFELAQKEASTVFSSSHEGIMVAGPDHRITKINPAFTRITGYTQEEIVGQTPRMLASGRHDHVFYQAMWHALDTVDCWYGEIWNRRKNGEVYAELLAISVVRDDAGRVQHYVAVFSDISRFKAHEAELDRVTNYDPLTGLPNRRLLADRLGQAIARCARSPQLLAVCFLDLDDFKAVNEQHGRAVGDQMLIGVAQNLKHVLRADDTLARLGGDEFALLLSDVGSPEDCARVLDKVLMAAALPVQVGDITASVTASIGVSLYPEDLADADTLLRHSDQAMYLAKDAGRNRYQLFDPENDRKVQAHRDLIARLQKALQEHQFELYYQPKVDLATGTVTGTEALVRWNHPEKGRLAPGEFLPYINGSSLEVPFGNWVIKTALAQAETWSRQGLPACVSANISAQHLLQPGFHDSLSAALADHPAALAAGFELEVLETAAIADIDEAVAILHRCRALGVHFALDDFGTGYSSLTYLRKLPVHTLKIDQSFVRNMLDDADDLGIVEGVIRLAKAFNRRVIAEGVETLAHGAALVQLGCHHAQGYGIAKPMPAAQFGAWVARWNSEAPWLALAGADLPMAEA